ncbi:BtrH N-terminal domain-containing protein [Acetivibrio clariflavus]|uniref:BtrH N-terminal domain-containing protein n=1 Tax=Acetivibrio clariflavus TaxID=288965 RepID=UPI000488F9DC|nr:BtrH N-terminal domain-containing protein [Acetivibrio clariflavus]
MKLIDSYKHIERREMLDCRIKSLKELVKHYGIKLSSYEVLLLSEAYSFMYTKVNIQGTKLPALPYAAVSHNDVDKVFLNNLNIKYEEKKMYSDDWEYMKSLIDQDIPILFKMDSRFLIEKDAAASKYEKLNLYYLSTILLVGYDEEKGEALIVLTNDDEREVVNRITLSDFHKSRCTKCIPFSPDGLCLYLKPDERINDIKDEDIRLLILKSLKRIVEIMLNQDEIYHIDMGAFITTGIKKGISAMKELVHDLKILLNQAEDEAISKMNQLLIIFLRNNMMFGTYSGYREEFGKSLKYCSEKYKIEKMYEIGQKFDNIANDWKNVFRLLSSIGHKKIDFAEGLNMVIQVWEKIIEAEQESYIEIMELLNQYSIV